MNPFPKTSKNVYSSETYCMSVLRVVPEFYKSGETCGEKKPSMCIDKTDADNVTDLDRGSNIHRNSTETATKTGILTNDTRPIVNSRQQYEDDTILHEDNLSVEEGETTAFSTDRDKPHTCTHSERVDVYVYIIIIQSVVILVLVVCWIVAVPIKSSLKNRTKDIAQRCFINNRCKSQQKSVVYNGSHVYEYVDSQPTSLTHVNHDTTKFVNSQNESVSNSVGDILKCPCANTRLPSGSFGRSASNKIYGHCNDRQSTDLRKDVLLKTTSRHKLGIRPGYPLPPCDMGDNRLTGDYSAGSLSPVSIHKLAMYKKHDEEGGNGEQTGRDAHAGFIDMLATGARPNNIPGKAEDTPTSVDNQNQSDQSTQKCDIEYMDMRLAPTEQLLGAYEALNLKETRIDRNDSIEFINDNENQRTDGRQIGFQNTKYVKGKPQLPAKNQEKSKHLQAMTTKSCNVKAGKL